MDSFQSAHTRELPGCGVTDAFAEGRDAVWTIYVSRTDAASAADRGRMFVGDEGAVADYERAAVAASDRCLRAAEACAETARRHGVPHLRTAQALVAYFDAYTVLQGYFQATSPLFTSGAEQDLDAVVQARIHDGAAGSLPRYSGHGGLKAVQEASEWWLTLLAARRQRWTPDERDDVLRRHLDRFVETGAIDGHVGADPFESMLRRWAHDETLSTPELETRAMRATKDVRDWLDRRRKAARELSLDEHSVTVAANLDTLGLRRMAIRSATSETTQVAYEAFTRVFALVRDEIDPVDGVRQLSRDEVLALARGEHVALDSARERLRRGLYQIHGAERTTLSGSRADAAIAGCHGRPTVRSMGF
ncbi:hypothetical protein J3R03_000119 [Actinoplanes couchii]|nr:hypothetical protein [Actinoplanes couchii]MDR6315923.1 hypothetical protein [Actinoplanes couchii]